MLNSGSESDKLVQVDLQANDLSHNRGKCAKLITN